MKCLFTAFLASLLSLNAIAQIPKIQKTMGGDDDDILKSMFLTKEGGLIVGGYSFSGKSGEKTERSRSRHAYDYWIVLLDSLGNIKADKTLGGDSFDELYSLQQTIDGGYILGGTSSSNASYDKTENTRGNGSADYWIIKLDSSLNTQWDRTIGGTTGDDFSSLQQTKDGGYILGGSSESDKSNEKTQSSRGGNDYWIVKLDAAGNIQWDKTIGGSGSDKLSSIMQTDDKGYILGGTSNSPVSNEKSENSRGDVDYWIVKLNSNGKIEWDKTFGGSALDQLYALQQTKDHGFILGGASYSGISGEKTQKNKGLQDYWVIKLNNLAAIEWDKTIGGSSSDLLTCLQQTKDSGYILGGISESSLTGDKTEKKIGIQDYWVVKLDELGNIKTDKTLGGKGFNDLYSIKEIKQDIFLLGGTSNAGVSGDKTEPSRGGYDYWVVAYNLKKLDLISAQNILPYNNTTLTIKLYPNPAKNTLHIQGLPANTKTKLIITDLSGNARITATANNTVYSLNIAQLTKGSYLLKIQTADEVITKTFIKE